MEDPVTVTISFVMEAKCVEKWDFAMFFKGCEYYNVDSIKAWIKLIPKIRKDLGSDTKFFENVYNYAFDISQDTGLKNVDRDIAITLWPIFLKKQC